MDVRKVYNELYETYGPQGWWPKHKGQKRPGFDPQFEVMVGAVLTQNTAWTNVEKALEAMHAQDCLDSDAVCGIHHAKLKSMIRPSGYYNQKSKKLKFLSSFVKALKGKPSREELLDIWGIGRETADSILLYAFNHPIFVVDTYTRRLLRAHGDHELADSDYDEIREHFESQLKSDAKLFNEYHALIVRWGKVDPPAFPLGKGEV